VTVTVEPGVEIIATGDVRLFVNGTHGGGGQPVRAGPQRPDAVEVRWRQAGPADVSIDIVSLAGRTAARACRNVLTEAGDVSVRWSRRLPGGALAPAGSYVPVLEAIATEGTRRRVMAPLPLR